MMLNDVSLESVAEHHGIKLDTLKRLVNRRKLAYKNVCGHWSFTPSQLSAFNESMTVRPQGRSARRRRPRVVDALALAELRG